MINLKREYFRNSMNKQAREAIFKKKRIVTQTNQYIEQDPFYQKMNQLFKQEFSMCLINDKLLELYQEYNLFPERILQIMTQINILGIKVAENREQWYINQFYETLSSNLTLNLDTFLTQVILHCDSEFESDPNTSELSNTCLWIMINLTLADGCVDYILHKTNLLSNLIELMSSKYETIVSRVLDLLFNITIEQEACFQLVQMKEFEKAFEILLKKTLPQNLVQKEAGIIRNLCYNLNEVYYPMVLHFMYDCITTESMNGLIEILTREKNCLKFLQDSSALCVKIFSRPSQSINFIIYLSTNADDYVLEKLESNYRIVDILLCHKSHNSHKNFQVFANLSTAESCLPSLRRVFYNIFDQYMQGDLKMKQEIAYFAGTYIKNCDVTYYQDLINHGIVELFVQFLQDCYDPNYIQVVLDALECLSIDEHAGQIFRRLGGKQRLELLNQNQSIIEQAQRIKWM